MALRERPAPPLGRPALLVLALAVAYSGPARAAASPGVYQPAAAQSPDWTAQLRTSLGGGYDGNVRHALPGAADASLPGAQAPAQASAFAVAALSAELGRAWPGVFHLGLGYELYQSTYAEQSLRSFGYLEQALEVRLSEAQRGFWGWSLALRGDLGFTGFAADVRPFQRSISFDPELVVGRNRALRLRLAARALAFESLDPELSFLSGRRLELRAGPEVDLAGWRLTSALRWRRDLLGEARDAPLDEEATCPGCQSQTVTPYTSRSWVAGLRLAAPMRWAVRPGAGARLERRRHDRPERTEILLPEGGVRRLDGRTRSDQRLWADTNLKVALGSRFTLTARYELFQNSSTFTAVPGEACAAGPCPSPGPPRRYRKHVLGLELEAEWM